MAVVGFISLAAAVGALPDVRRSAHRARARAARRQSKATGELKSLGPSVRLVAAQPPARSPGLRPRDHLGAVSVHLRECGSATSCTRFPFWAIVGLLVAFAINNGYFAGRIAEQNVWPVTYLMVQAVEGSATLFFYIVATLYAAELVWRERDTHFDGIHDALPMRETIGLALQVLRASPLVELILLTLTMLCGIFMQTLAGYYHYEFLQYFKELYVVTFPQVLTFTLWPSSCKPSSATNSSATAS